MIDPSSTFSRITPTRASSDVIAQIRTAILSGRFRPGDRLPTERELAQQFGVSRVTVRDALRALEAGGLVRVKVGGQGGPYVAEPDIALDSYGNAIAIWTSGANGVVQSAMRPAASGRWQRPVDISTAGASKPLVSNDTTLSVWNRSSAPRVAVEASDLTRGGPVLQNLRIPKKGTVRARLTFSVTPAPWSAPLAGEPLWRFGDGRSTQGRRVVHRYLRPGSFRVGITSRDADGDTTTATQRVRVLRRVTG